MVWCGSKNGYLKKHVCIQKIGLRVENMITISSLKAAMILGTYSMTIQ
jgi:hypothetical protein